VRIEKGLKWVRQSIRRSGRDVILSSIGIVVGISTLLLFTALGAGVKNVVLEEVFTVRQLEVVPRSMGMAESMANRLLGGEEPGLDEKTLQDVRGIDGVSEAYPRMKLTFPASVRGGREILGQDLVLELVADGIPAEVLSQGLQSKFSGDDPIPVIANPRVLEIYNSSLKTSLAGAKGAISNLPELSPSMLVGLEARAVFGRSFLGQSARGGEPTERRLRLVGFSSKAIDLGATMPLEVVKRLNQKYGATSQRETYHSIVVEVASNRALTDVVDTLTDDMDLQLSGDYRQARRAGRLIDVVTLVFNLIGLVILGIAAINIMHTFFRTVLERRGEIGLMRAIGATPGDIRWLILGESTVIGLIGGLVGVGAGYGLMAGVDWLFATQVADFPFKPDTLFVLEGWMIAAALAAALVSCWLGALLPAIRASRLDPAEALTRR
jgi:ABC-type antimicrobial peptide transport system permease subunit